MFKHRSLLIVIFCFALLFPCLSGCTPAGVSAVETTGDTPSSGSDDTAQVTTPQHRYVTVPELVGANIDDITTLLDHTRIEYSIEYEHSIEPVNSIINADYVGIRAGSYIKVDESYPIVITVSIGKKISSENVEATGEKVVYLTFDDGPNQYNDKVLEVLEKYDVKATFFTVGTFVDYYPARAKNIVEAGHVLACHSYDHEFSTVYSSPDALVESIKKWESSVEAAIGYVPSEKIFRYPGGSNNGYIPKESFGTYHEALADIGYRSFDWTLSNNDRYNVPNTDDRNVIIEYLKESTVSTLALCRNSSLPKIFLMHDTTSITPDALEWIIEYFIDEGYTFATLDELDGDWLFRLPSNY